MKLLILYLSSFIAFSFLSFLFIDQNFFYLNNLYLGFHTQHRQIVSIFYFLIISGLFLSYLFILKKIKDIEINYKYILVLVIIGTFSYPAILSFDIFNYIATAKVAFLYWENPYVVMPIEFVGDPILSFTHAANKVALYGPLWILLTFIPFMLSFGNYLLAIVLFKYVVIVFYLLTLYLINIITKSKFAVIYFALNPLVLIEIFISGHNDIVMMFFALLGIFLLKKNRYILGILLLLISILVKFATMFLLPVVMYILYLKLQKREVNWERIWILSMVLMFVVFIFSFIREEIYPWYFVWPLLFISLLRDRKTFKTIVLLFCFGLMLRYIPFMYLGLHTGITPYLRTILMLTPSAFYLLIILFKKFFKR